MIKHEPPLELFVALFQFILVVELFALLSVEAVKLDVRVVFDVKRSIVQLTTRQAKYEIEAIVVPPQRGSEVVHFLLRKEDPV